MHNNLKLEITEILKEALHAEGFVELQKNFPSEDTYSNFLDTLVELILTKSERELSDFMDLYDFERIGTLFYSRKNDIIEKIAELFYSGISDKWSYFMQKTNNSIFIEHLSFLENLNLAVKISERERIKNKLKNLDDIEAFEISDQEITRAVSIIERAHLKSKFKEIDSEQEKEEELEPDYVGKVIGISEPIHLEKKNKKSDYFVKNTTISFYKYAAIILMVLLASSITYIYIKNLAKRSERDMAMNHVHEKSPSSPYSANKIQPSVKLKKNNLIEKPILPKAQILQSKTNVISTPNMGFSAVKTRQLTTTIINIGPQLSSIYHQIKAATSENSAYLKQCRKLQDSLIRLQGTYLLDLSQNQLTLYSSPKKIEFTPKKVKIFLYRELYYLKYGDIFYLLDPNKNQLNTINDDDLIDELNVLEN